MAILKWAQQHIGWAFAGLFILTALSVYFYAKYVMDTNGGTFDPWLVGLETMLTAVGVGVVVVLIEKIGNSSLLDEKITPISEDLRELKSDLKTGLTKIQTDTASALELKFGYGWEGITREPQELDSIGKMESGRVRWLNTVFKYPQINANAVLEAVRRGVDVQILLMKPGSDFAKYRGMYTAESYKDPDYVIENQTGYELQIAACYVFLRQAFNRYTEIRENDQSCGNLEIRFYSDPAGIPIFILEDDHFKKAYSGFYLNSASSELPYIVWQGVTQLQDAFIENLEDYFERKWYFSEDGDIGRLDQDEEIAKFVRERRPDAVESGII